MLEPQKTYGITHFQNSTSEKIKQHISNLNTLGFSIEESFLEESLLETLRNNLDQVYLEQERFFSQQTLKKISELDMCRAPLLYDQSFLSLATHPFLIDVVENAIQNKAILHLQNGIINRPNTEHHQQSWHRDLPYQNFVSSKPLSISALITLDPFTVQTGATQVVVGTHKQEINQLEDLGNFEIVSAVAKAGSVIFFDSMLYHRAGINTSNITRRAINHVYTSPILRQQYDFPKAFDQEKLTDTQKRILGFDFEIPMDDKAWRIKKLNKLNSML